MIRQQSNRPGKSNQAPRSTGTGPSLSPSRESHHSRVRASLHADAATDRRAAGDDPTSPAFQAARHRSSPCRLGHRDGVRPCRLTPSCTHFCGTRPASTVRHGLPGSTSSSLARTVRRWMLVRTDRSATCIAMRRTLGPARNVDGTRARGRQGRRCLVSECSRRRST